MRRRSSRSTTCRRFRRRSRRSIRRRPAKGILIVGKLRNQFVPIFIRTGAANADLTQGPPSADDESGISFLAADGDRARLAERQYTGVDSAFNYRATALVGAQATLLDPFNASQAALTRALNLDYTQKVPGVVTTVHADAASAGDRQVRVHRRRIRVPRHERYEQPVLHGRRIRAVTQAWMERRRRADARRPDRMRETS